jgi:flagellar protein FlgJ
MTTVGARSAAGLAIDGRSVEQLRQDARSDPKAAAQQVGKQFEALFMQQLLKSMRDATMKSGMWDSASSDLYSDMLDQQLAQKVAGGTGLADMIAKQLTRHIGEPAGKTGIEPTGGKASPTGAATGPATSMAPGTPTTAAFKNISATPVNPADVPVRIGSVKPSQAEFVRNHLPAAQAAADATGIPASYIVGQAAHESGWGAREIKHPDGSPAHNLFGIKAGASWTGKVAEITTTEYVNGVAKKVVAKFRAYDSYADAFRDYAELIKNSPRYSGVIKEGQTVAGFAGGLQKAGYATDPAYADKLSKVINHTVRLARVVI